ncbi:hypothetical protein E1258_14310 [Micromonospora sp. KC207]|uniref:hypothetical protein n=1 Tax=Micromonospora sp. KC207 TaxID=2530377 RepID=UPI001046776D|nr:hypothetical protein [Micromonospora sp. KC207]TDC60577.1 hypothetical protein E1258_14310 [Micromonospora sp. KC207]
MSESKQLADQPVASPEAVAAAAALAVPATLYGMPPTAQLFFAVVNSNGSLVRGFGTASSSRLGVGIYEVVFSHDLTRSAYIGTIGLPGSVGASPSGEIAVVGRAGVPNGVFVQTFDSTGAPADRAFHLAIAS